MLETSTNKLIDIAVAHGYIKEEQQPEYLYGLSILIDVLINDITMLTIGFILHMPWDCIIFWFAYKLLRKYVGGFHFSTSLKCYLSSCIMCLIALICIRYLPYNALSWSIVVMFAAALLFIVSPVAAVTKPLDEDEKIIFGKAARIIVIFLLAVYIIMTMLNILVVLKAIALSMVCAAVFAVAGKLHLSYLCKNV